MQIKTIMDTTTYLLEWLKLKVYVCVHNIKCQRGHEKLDLPYIHGGNISDRATQEVSLAVSL